MNDATGTFNRLRHAQRNPDKLARIAAQLQHADGRAAV